MTEDEISAMYWTGLCTSCGDEWQEDETPTICPECSFHWRGRHSAEEPVMTGPKSEDPCGAVSVDEHNPTDPRCDYAPGGSAPPIGLDKTVLTLVVASVAGGFIASRVANAIWSSRWLKERDALMRLTGAVAATPGGEGDPAGDARPTAKGDPGARVVSLARWVDQAWAANAEMHSKIAAIHAPRKTGRVVICDECSHVPAAVLYPCRTLRASMTNPPTGPMYQPASSTPPPIALPEDTP